MVILSGVITPPWVFNYPNHNFFSSEIFMEIIFLVKLFKFENRFL